MGIDCLKCTTSPCCKEYIVEVDKEDYSRLVSLGYKEYLLTETEKFINKYPEHKGKEKQLDEMHQDLYETTGIYATLIKRKDGYCELIDKETMLCSIHEDRPKVCRDYTTNRCAKIRTINP